MVTTKNEAARHWLILAALLLALAGCTPPGPRALLAGKELLDAGKPREAAEKFKAATALMPTNALAFNYLGLACQEAGQIAEAERAYSRALGLNRELAEVHFNLGCLFLAQNKLEQAKSELTAYTLGRGNSPEGFLKLGTAQLRAREPVTAERSFNEALRLDPKNPEALTGLGLVRLQRNRAAEAAQLFSKALQEQPDYRPALLNLAVVAQEQLKDRPLALRHYQQLLALKPPPENAAAIQAIVRNLEQELAPRATPPVISNTVSQAKPPTQADAPKAPLATSLAQPPPPQKLETPVTVVPKAPSPTNVPRPSALIQTRTAPAADVAAKSSASQELPKAPLSPSSPPKQPAAGTPSPAPAALETVTLSNEPALKTGQAPLPATASSSRKEPAPLPSVSSSDDNATSREAAFARYSYKNPAKPAPGNHSEAERSYAQGVQAQQSQRLPEAMQAYRRAVQLDPAFFNAHYNLALAAAASGNQQLALATYETALALRPDFLEARYNFALVLKQAGYPVDAANELQKIVASYPNDSRSHLALGNLYAQQLGKPALARRHYLKVLETDPRNPQAGAIHFWLADNPK